MSLTADDRLNIQEVIALHGHLCDSTSYHRFDEVFTSDLEVDASDLGLAPLPAGDPSQSRLDTYIAAAHRNGPARALAVHVTNIIVGEDGDDARAWSKGITVNPDGTVASFSYEDQLVRTDSGWRIRRRRVSARRQPGNGVEPLTVQRMTDV
jgi:hypothetical protein